MLIRLKVSGFKNLVDVDIRFGAFTCVAGANGVGKSNLFDAIRFLSAIADRPLIEAAKAIRDEGGRTADVRSLFHRVGDEYAAEMSFEAEMIVPLEGVDDLGQKATATITFLRYSLNLAYRYKSLPSQGTLEIIKEELVYINLGDAKKQLWFPHSDRWRNTAVRGRRSAPFISTEGEGTNRVIKLHKDGGSSGGTRTLLAVDLPRTVLSDANAAESRTALLARKEMQSWRLLQLEPSALRQPDEFTAPTKLDMDGSHLPATLYYLAMLNRKHSLDNQSDDAAEVQVYSQVANRLAELIDDVWDLGIDRDEGRKLLTLMVTGKDGTSHSARALSDGTLRFLALAVLQLDPESQGLLCLEEPENGIHPERIPKMLKLLEDIATDVDEPIDSDNPLCQVIINTHSPAVVMQVPEDSLLVAELRETEQAGQRFKRVCFSCLPKTWRQLKALEPEKVKVVSKGEILGYLSPILSEELEPDVNLNIQEKKYKSSIKRRVVDREDIKQLLNPGFPTELA